MTKKVIPIVAGVAAVGGLAYWAMRKGGANTVHQAVINNLTVKSAGTVLTPKLVHTGWQDRPDTKEAKAPLSTWLWVFTNATMHENPEAITCLSGTKGIVSIEMSKLTGNAVEFWYGQKGYEVLIATIPAVAVGYQHYGIPISG